MASGTSHRCAEKKKLNHGETKEHGEQILRILLRVARVRLASVQLAYPTKAPVREPTGAGALKRRAGDGRDERHGGEGGGGVASGCPALKRPGDPTGKNGINLAEAR